MCNISGIEGVLTFFYLSHRIFIDKMKIYRKKILALSIVMATVPTTPSGAMFSRAFKSAGDFSSNMYHSLKSKLTDTDESKIAYLLEQKYPYAEMKEKIERHDFSLRRDSMFYYKMSDFNPKTETIYALTDSSGKIYRVAAEDGQKLNYALGIGMKEGKTEDFYKKWLLNAARAHLTYKAFIKPELKKAELEGAQKAQTLEDDY